MLTGAIAAAFAKQASFCRLFDAPFTALVCEAAALAFDESSAMGRAVIAWPGEAFADALMMRVTGGFHALVRSGAVPVLTALYPPAPLPDVRVLADALRAVLADPALDAALLPWLAGPPQTNEVMRSAVLMPGMMVIAAMTGLPLRLFELGASAGLNLNMDRFAYDLGGVAAGDAASAVRITPVWTGPAPPDLSVQVLERRGVDINPLDVADPATVTRLVAFVWPDQPGRIARAEAAIAIARSRPPPERGDAAAFAQAQVAVHPGSTAVVYHSIAHQYFPPETKARLAAHMGRAGATATAQAPLAWLRYEMDDASVADLPTLRLTLWRGQGEESQLLARAHPHGSFVQWQ
ncbi:DUF2332 family protein [Sandarakinorhabdus sp.]|uniref:DUF2332 domain-containing protein n=1 Tax=Sandarakinorhabdus sp. TaxID=1916663 RepID=UPI00286DF6BB|nr:DUF2332 family protein [Sandarakinorhabdus sp.]